jgi:hypothetical protein
MDIDDEPRWREEPRGRRGSLGGGACLKVFAARVGRARVYEVSVCRAGWTDVRTVLVCTVLVRRDMRTEALVEMLQCRGRHCSVVACGGGAV